MSNSNGQQGTSYTSPADYATEFNSQVALVWSILAKCSTATLVKVVAVTNTGGVAPVGFVDVLPLVSQLDGDGVSWPYTVPISKCPYFRLQGGTNAVILDPQVNDIGIAVFADRDISSVKNTKAAAPPGSGRLFSMSDGLYLGGLLNGTPTQYVQFNSAGITINSPNEVTVTAPQVVVNASTSAQVNTATATVDATTATNITTPTMTLTGNLVVNGTSALNGAVSGGGGGGATAAFSGPITAGGNISTTTGNVTAGGIDLLTHHHTGVTTGSGNTGGPAG